MWTTEWSLSSVYSFMFFQGPFVFELIFTTWATEWFLNNVYSFMFFKAPLSNFPPLCSISCSSTRKLITTVWATEWFLTTVHSPNIFGLITATWATEWFLTTMMEYFPLPKS